MFNRFCYALLIICISISSVAQKTDRKLEDKLRQLTADFKGDVGIYIKQLTTGKTVAIQADSIFPTASMVKIPILIGIMDKLNKKELSYHQPLIYKDSLLYEGEDILGSFKDGETIQLAKIMMLMMTTSDNTASLWLQSLAGTGSRINELMAQLGLEHTRVNSRTPGRKDNQQIYGWGQTTPREMVTLMEMIYRGQVIDKAASDQMLRIMGRNFWDEEAISVHPPTVFIASKNGAVNASRSETLLVMAPKGPYIFSIITKNQQDQSWEPENEGWVLARKVAALLWEKYGK
ncbi:class A beta-lactamase-related serine hydrolase [Flavihumibacter sp. RY-1]|uniref:beta-lactamase n=1 Tax=Flavihumibacter fluminis TaxID=2909236 RepID=A0ABS9BI85_9BACT|nr:serine hydrolase [Flavihumibacter fluminis]MCF1715437.1 class A beta-lactamase-related serine hydrolase [Flavihumibacter fluminis]